MRARHRRRGRVRRDARRAEHGGGSSTASRWCRGGRSTYRGTTFTEMDTEAVARPAARGGLRRRARPHQRAGQPAREAGRRTSSRSAPPASTSSPPSTSSTWSRSTTRSSGSPASGSARPCPTRWCGPPTRSSWSTCPRTRCAGGWRTATSTGPSRSTPRSRRTSGSATSPRCASSPCCGWPTGSTTRSATTGARTRSQEPWPAKERIVVAVTGGAESETLLRRGARLAQRAAGSELLAVHVIATDGLRQRRRAPDLAGPAAGRHRSAAPSTRSSARTSRPRSSTSRRAPTPR